MSLKEFVFGGQVKTGHSGGAYRDSIQAWLPIKNIIGGVVITKDNRFIKILEVLPVNIYLKSAGDRQNIISAFASYLKIAPDDLQMIARTLPADTQSYVEQMHRYAEQEGNAACREMIEDSIQQIGLGVARNAMRHRFFLVFQYEARMRAKRNTVSAIVQRLNEEADTARRYRGRSALTGTIIGVDPLSINTRDPESGTVKKKTMYCAIVVPYRVRILIPASEMWEQGQERPDYVLQNMVGAVINFVIIKVDRDSGFAIASRKIANRSQRYFFAHRSDLNRENTRLKCRMLAVGPRRCLVECFGHDLALTQRDLRYTAIPDLRVEYHPGMELDCIVKSYDPEAEQLVISVKETEVNPFFGAQQRHPVGARRLAIIAGKYGGGVFCNLPDGVTCMCNYSYQHDDADFIVGEQVMLLVQRYDTEKRQMYGKIMSKR